MSEIDEAASEHVRSHLRRHLQDKARRYKTVTYRDLVDEVGGRDGERFSGPRSPALFKMLGEINEFEPKFLDEPLLLSAVVIHAGSDRQPGSGFFKSAKALRFSVPGTEEGRSDFWARQLERVWTAYGKDGDGR